MGGRRRPARGHGPESLLLLPVRGRVERAVAVGQQGPGTLGHFSGGRGRGGLSTTSQLAGKEPVEVARANFPG